MKDIIREVTVHRHDVYGEVRTVKDDNGYILFIVADLASFLKRKSITKALERQGIEIIDVKIACLTAINKNEQLLEERIVSAIMTKDLLHMVRSSQLSTAKFVENWLRRDVLKEDSMWSKDISFNREYFKDEYIESQISELELLKGKVNILEYEILRKHEQECFKTISEEEVKTEVLKGNKKCKKVTTYNHPLFGEVRTVTTDDEVLFIANDIAKVLKYSSPQMAVKAYCTNLIKVSINSEIYLSNIDEYSSHKVMINAIELGDVQRLIKYSSKVDKRMFELWLRSEVLKEGNENDKNIVYQGEYYKDEYIKVISKEIDYYRAKVKELEEEMFSYTEKIVQEDVNLITNYDLAKKLESKFRITKKKNK